MEFDRTRVAIRQRGFLEIADLSVVLIRRYAASLFGYWMLGAVPFMAINLLLIGWIPYFADRYDLLEEEFEGEQLRYVWLLACLVYLQSPLAMAPLTLWLGRAVFQDRPTFREVIEDLKSSAFRLVLVLGFWRGPLIAMILIATNWRGSFAPVREIFWMICVMVLFGSIRLARPYLPEILLLERCPLRATKTDTISAGKRSSILHSPMASDVIGRQLVVACLAILGSVSTAFSLAFVWAYLLNQMGWHLYLPLFIIPLTFWLIAGGATVVRFLTYLDTRIRLEGWEVELTLRAEAERWIAKETFANTAGMAQMIKSQKTESLPMHTSMEQPPLDPQGSSAS